MRKVLASLMVVVLLAVAGACSSDATNNKKACAGCSPCGGGKCAPCGGKKCSPCGGSGKCGVNANAEYPDVVLVAYHADW